MCIGCLGGTDCGCAMQELRHPRKEDGDTDSGGTLTRPSAWRRRKVGEGELNVAGAVTNEGGRR